MALAERQRVQDGGQRVTQSLGDGEYRTRYVPHYHPRIVERARLTT